MKKSILFIGMLLIANNAWPLDVYLAYQTEFYDLFDSGEQWDDVDPDQVKNRISTLVSQDLSSFGIALTANQGDAEITVEIGGSCPSAFGVAHPFIGAFFYDDNPHAHIYPETFAANAEWQGILATYDRIGQAMANTICHEIGHLLNLWHAYQFSCYDPYDSGTLQYPYYYPSEIYELQSNDPTKISYESQVPNPEDSIMNSFYGNNEDRTDNRVFSTYSSSIMSFHLAGGGTVTKKHDFGIN